MSKKRPIHFIYIDYYTDTCMICNTDNKVVPIEYKMNDGCYFTNNIGTFDATKVTCKRCLKNEFYKEALDKVNHPLFHWRENT